MNKDLILLKDKIQQKLNIYTWNPSENILRRIATRIAKLNKEPSKQELSRIVHSEYGEYKTIICEGVDNSDLITLLKLAQSINTNNDK